MESYQGMHEMGSSAAGGGSAYPSAPTTHNAPPSAPPGARSISLEVGERPNPPSIQVTVPSGYEPASGEMQIEVSDPHRVGEGMSKHLEYKVTYWTTLPQYKQRSGCVTRRYSDFEWLWRMLRSSMDGVIVPSLPQKTLVANDDPTSAAIEKRRHSLAVLVARVAAHPVMRTSSDLQIFLEVRDAATLKAKRTHASPFIFQQELAMAFLSVNWYLFFVLLSFPLFSPPTPTF